MRRSSAVPRGTLKAEVVSRDLQRGEMMRLLDETHSTYGRGEAGLGARCECEWVSTHSVGGWGVREWGGRGRWAGGGDGLLRGRLWRGAAQGKGRGGQLSCCCALP